MEISYDTVDPIFESAGLDTLVKSIKSAKDALTFDADFNFKGYEAIRHLTIVKSQIDQYVKSLSSH